MISIVRGNNADTVMHECSSYLRIEDVTKILNNENALAIRSKKVFHRESKITKYSCLDNARGVESTITMGRDSQARNGIKSFRHVI